MKAEVALLSSDPKSGSAPDEEQRRKEDGMRHGTYRFILAAVFTAFTAAPAPAAASPIDWLAPLWLLAPPPAPHYTVTPLPLSPYVIFVSALTPVQFLNASGQVVGIGPSGGVVWTRGTVTLLSTLGGRGAYPWLINNRGQISGRSDNSHGGIRAFFWDNGAIQSLGSIVEGETDADAINDAGQVVGQSWAGKSFHAFLWDKGVMQDLGTLGGQSSAALGINAGGQVIGRYLSSADLVRAFLWENGTMTDLPTLGGPGSWASAINNAGQVAGYASTTPGSYSPTHACLWDKGRVIDLGTLGSDYSYAIGLNDAGQVLGWSRTADGSPHRFLWENGTMTDLGTFDYTLAYVRQLNAAGQVVGEAETSQKDAAGHPIVHAFLWQNGTKIDLDSFLPADPTAPTPLLQSINDFGQIVVSRAGKGAVESFLLTPSP